MNSFIWTDQRANSWSAAKTKGIISTSKLSDFYESLDQCWLNKNMYLIGFVLNVLFNMHCFNKSKRAEFKSQFWVNISCKIQRQLSFVQIN